MATNVGNKKDRIYIMSRKRGLLIRLEDFISSNRGQRFFNFAYSIGAAVVIWGALFKILHLSGGNTLLAVGMGTEVIMFILTAFDKPPVMTSQYIESPAINRNQQEPRLNNTSSAACEIPEGLADEMKGTINEMAKLRETTAALNTLYELQLKSVSSQLSTIESGSHDAMAMREMMARSAEQNRRYCEETVKMADNMAQLNSIYERMIAAMSTCNPSTRI